MKNILLYLLLLFSIPQYAQSLTWGLTLTSDYVSSNTENLSLSTTVLSADYVGFASGRLGAFVNKRIYKFISLDLETGYCLGGVGQVINPNGSPDDRYKRTFHNQFYAVLKPTFSIKEKVFLGIGAGFNARFKKAMNPAFQNTFWSFNLSAAYKINDRFKIGVQYINYLDPYLKTESSLGNISNYWKSIGLTVRYTF